MDKVFIARRVATKIRGAEHSLDAAMIDATEMVAELIRARKELGVAANVGDAAIAKMTEAVAALSEARTAMVASHAELAKVQLRLGIRTRMDTEEKAEPVESNAALREVA